MRFNEYPILKLLLAYILGIVLGSFVLPDGVPWWPLGILFLILGALAWPKKYLFNYTYRFISGAFILLIFTYLGVLIYQNSETNLHPRHFGNHLQEQDLWIVSIRSMPEAKEKSVALEVEIEYNLSQKQKFEGKALVYLQKDSLSEDLFYGDYLLINQQFKLITPPQNPYQFNFAAYSSRKGIYHQAYLKSEDWKLIPNLKNHNLAYFALLLRNRMIAILRQNELNEDELAVASGILLGEQSMISDELRASYSGSGASHVLSVSGLHVGIVFMILSFLLKPFHWGKHDKLLKALFVIFILWLYALLTGLSPSVNRSAGMFTFIAVGQSLRRHTHILGSLSASAFVLLLINPNYLFDLGFQLSYSAVIAIVALQKPISDWWIAPNKITDAFWQLVVVSVAAQVGTAPISIFYFHQFPNLFLLTNFIVIPLTYIILVYAILVLVISPLSWVAHYAGMGLSNLIEFMNWIITQIEGLSFGVTRDLYLNLSMLFLSLAMISIFAIMLRQLRKWQLFAQLIMLVAFLGFNLFKYDTSNEMILYDTSKNTYLAVYENGNAHIFCDSAVMEKPDLVRFQISENEIRKGIKKRYYHLISEDLSATGATFKIQFPFLAYGNQLYYLSTSKERRKGIDSLDWMVLNAKEKLLIKPDSLMGQRILASQVPTWKIKLLEGADSNKLYEVRKKGAYVQKL